MAKIISEKEVLGDALATEKACTSNYNMYANECVHKNVRDVMMSVLEQEHSIQQDVFNMMHSKGYYPTPEAESEKVDEAKQRYASCVKTI